MLGRYYLRQQSDVPSAGTHCAVGGGGGVAVVVGILLAYYNYCLPKP